MGHYDECYEADERDSVRRQMRELNNSLMKFIENGSMSDKEFICEIIDDIKAYKGFFKILHKEK